MKVWEHQELPRVAIYVDIDGSRKRNVCNVAGTRMHITFVRLNNSLGEYTRIHACSCSGRAPRFTLPIAQNERAYLPFSYHVHEMSKKIPIFSLFHKKTIWNILISLNWFFQNIPNKEQEKLRVYVKRRKHDHRKSRSREGSVYFLHHLFHLRSFSSYPVENDEISK